MTDKEPTAIVPASTDALAPLAAPAIELETTFEDGSLEMNDAGDHFRVAQSLQRVAIRQAFMLRTQNVAATEYEEIGQLRFDATPFGTAWKLVAELEVSASSGQTAQLDLWNLTAGEKLGEVSSGSVVTAKVTVNVTLPSSEALYSVRLRRVGAEVEQRVSCRSVVLEAA